MHTHHVRMRTALTRTSSTHAEHARARLHWTWGSEWWGPSLDQDESFRADKIAWSKFAHPLLKYTPVEHRNILWNILKYRNIPFQNLSRPEIYPKYTLCKHEIYYEIYRKYTEIYPVQAVLSMWLNEIYSKYTLTKREIYRNIPNATVAICMSTEIYPKYTLWKNEIYYEI